MAKCKADTKSGRRCTANAGESGFCWAHDPALARKRATAHREGGRAHRIPKVSGEAVQIAGADDCLKVVNAAIADAWQLDNSAARSRVLLAGASTAVSVLQIGELEQRVRRLEEALAAKG